MTTQAERWEAWKAPETLERCVRLFFEILDIEEVSDNGRRFHPNVFSSCRVWDTHRMNRILTRMKDLTKRDVNDNSI